MKIDGNFNQEEYIKYLRELKVYIDEHFDDGDYHLLHDGHRAHSTKAVKEMVLKEFGKEYDTIVIPHPPDSPGDYFNKFIKFFL